MVHLDGYLKTDDMSLVALISTHGYTPTMQWKDKRAKLVFWLLSEAECDEFLQELVEDYRSGAARVEPQRFTRELRAVRRGLYDFMGHQGVPVHS
jgi:hypothetical protein